MSDRHAPDPGERRGPPDVDRGPTRPLTSRAARLRDRAGDLDRAARFRQRLEQVQRAEAARRRRVRWLAGLAVAVVLVVGPLLGAFLGTALERSAITGAMVGLAASAGALALYGWAQRYARSRGAVAWDWRSGRHVVHGDPSAQVQALDGRSGNGPHDRDRSRFTR